MMIFMTMKMRRLHVLALALKAVPAVTRQHGHSRRGTMIPLVRITLLLLTTTTQTSFADDDSEKKESSRQKRFRINNDAFGGERDMIFFPSFPSPFFFNKKKKKKTRYKKKKSKEKKDENR
tara:strand:- start:1526 stop:1888 length:363 start_codon:yes stop_codon:yes gene_type:complete